MRYNRTQQMLLSVFPNLQALWLFSLNVNYRNQVFLKKIRTRFILSQRAARHYIPKKPPHQMIMNRIAVLSSLVMWYTRTSISQNDLVFLVCVIHTHLLTHFHWTSSLIYCKSQCSILSIVHGANSKLFCVCCYCVAVLIILLKICKLYDESILQEITEQIIYVYSECIQDNNMVHFCYL